MMPQQTGSATLLVAKNFQDAQEQAAYDRLAAALAARLDQPVIPFPIDQSQQRISQILVDLLRHGVLEVVTLPIFLTPTDYAHHAVPDAVKYISRRWPFMRLHLGTPFVWQDWLALLGEQLANVSGNDTAVILAAHDTNNPAVHSDIAKLARLIYETFPAGWVDMALIGQTSSTLPQTIRRYQAFGAARVVVIPYMLFEGEIYQNLVARVEDAPSQGQVRLLSSLSTGCVLIDHLLKKHQQALADTTLLPPSPEEFAAEIAAARKAEAQGKKIYELSETNEYEQMKSKIDAILPPRYQGRTDEVSASPMSAADLLFDDEGAVLWDQIFGVDDPNNPYCELALAGGPAHRGELLEAVDGHVCLADPGKYAAALDECGRGINMITGMGIVESAIPGWVGVQCDSEEMALWLLRAIIVENVMVRREEDAIFLPVGPHYTLKDQIKSIVTVTAKTWHYWIEHITFQNLMRAAKEEAAD